MRLAHIDVTLDDIAHGERMDCKNCPLARALARALPDAAIVSVASYLRATFVVDGKPRNYSVPTPFEAVSFMNAFDGGRPVSPMMFDVVLHRAP